MTANLDDSQYRKIFESLQGSYLIMLPDLTIVAANNAYLRTTKTKREEIVGKKLLDVFPDDPNDHDKEVTNKLILALDSVVKKKRNNDGHF